jgi:hypothetical protein
MSDIFYTSVDANLQIELNARAAAGKRNRTTQDFNFMLGKIANVEITPYDVEYTKETEGEGDNKKVRQVISKKTPFIGSVLGGKSVLGEEFLPSGPNGFLSNRAYKVINQTNPNESPIPIAKNNISKRIPPYITSAEISIGDNSMGMMNTATVNVTIPNPGRDLDYFESVYLRPGRQVTMKIQHPESAIITQPLLETGSLPSLETLKKIDKTITENELELKYRKMNTNTLDAVIVSFTLDYQPDGAVNASLSMRGASQLYTDVSMYIDTDSADETETDKKDEETENKITNKTFWEQINSDYTKIYNSIESGSKGLWNDVTPAVGAAGVIYGEPAPGIEWQRYATLSWIVSRINKYIITKTQTFLGKREIVFTDENDLCSSTYYPEIVSADPMVMFINGNNHNKYGDLVWMKKWAQGSLGSVGVGVFYPSRFYINLDYIHSILNQMKEDEQYDVNTFLETISLRVYRLTGGVVDLKLISHPEYSDLLLYYDSNNVLPKPKDEKPLPPAEPYQVPMFANDEKGTIIRDFTFSGKLPTDASNLAYVLNQDPSEISESDIAPFLSYMYSATVTTRDISGNEIITNQVDQNKREEVIKKYEETHKKYLKELREAIKDYGKNSLTKEYKNSLSEKLSKYVQFPKPKIQETNQLKAPVIPFDCSFTIDGINGFKYGDIVQFNGLPKRYTQNAVFSIISITHTVDNSGIWTTQLRCIMRPKIE